MSENFLSIFLTIAFFILIGYQVIRSRRKKAMRRYNRTINGKDTGQTAGSSDPFGDQTPEDAMAAFRDHLEQLQSLSQGQQEAEHEPQTHVVQILSTTYAKLTELDKRIKVFERKAEEYKKRHPGLENP
ncbi:MAG: hypothetical protein U9Q05_00385 [Thermodesulfobacteriota bacterium]|nr:hypothetical protein [Thermodesulfobacteriota bacterium]